MRQTSEDRRRRAVLLSARLEAIGAARHELTRQLEDLDAESRSVSLERNILYNLDTPTSNIPDEVLAMVFEEGMRPRSHVPHFGTLVSHVSHHWRDVALATPTLWNKLRYIAQYEDEVNPISSEQLRERARAFLSRARLHPVDIYIEGFEDCSMEFIQLISEHVGHCRQLRTREVGQDCLTKLLECFSTKPIPLLTSIDLSSKFVIAIPGQLFPQVAPRLTTVQLDSLEKLGQHVHIPAFSSVTCLRLTGIFIEVDDSEEYSSFRDGLMGLLSLHHLELQVAWLVMMPHYLPIVLPTIQFLKIDANDFPDFLAPLISVIQAASLTTLSLTAWVEEGNQYEIDMADELALHLTSLRHLILTDGFEWPLPNFSIFAQLFPRIERLSLATESARFSIPSALAAVLCDTSAGEGNGGPQWPKLQTIAMSAFQGQIDAYALHGIILNSQQAGHGIRKLNLPESWLSDADAEELVELRKIVAIEKFHVDWLTPFEQAEWED